MAVKAPSVPAFDFMVLVSHPGVMTTVDPGAAVPRSVKDELRCTTMLSVMNAGSLISAEAPMTETMQTMTLARMYCRM